MKNIMNRFWNWIFHPSIQRQTVTSKATMYRYPSPGSNIPDSQPPDYRQPFQHSQYNIRYQEMTHDQRDHQASIVHAQRTTLDPKKKLILLGYLRKEDRENQDAVDEASRKYEADFKHSPEDPVRRNDYQEFFPPSREREGLREAFEIELKISKENFDINVTRNEDQNKNIDFYPLQSLDMYASQHFQQGRIENEYRIAELRKAKIDNHGINMRKGEANFWKALDDSNEGENVEKVQKKISTGEAADFRLRENKMEFEFDGEGNVVDLHLKKNVKQK